MFASKLFHPIGLGKVTPNLKIVLVVYPRSLSSRISKYSPLRNNQAICCHGGSSSYRAWGRVDCLSYEFHHVSRETIESLGLCPKIPLFCPWFLTIVPSHRMPRQTCGPWRKRWPFMLEVHNLMQQHRACWMHWAWKLAHRTACRRSYSFDISICINIYNYTIWLHVVLLKRFKWHKFLIFVNGRRIGRLPQSWSQMSQ